MSCGELERLFVAGAPEEAALAHRAGCPSCAALGNDIESATRILSTLRAPAPSPFLIASLQAIASRTVHCEAADLLAASEIEEEISPADRERLAFHRSRCEACAEAAGVLTTASKLAAPAPAPWVLGRLAAGRPEKKRPSVWRFVANPKGAIALAYAAAVVVMLTGFNPADLARKAGVARLEETAKISAQNAGRSLGDRIGAFEEDAMRRLAVWKGRVTGYGRAAISRAIQLVMKNESQTPPRRGKTSEEKGSRKDETRTETWRA